MSKSGVVVSKIVVITGKYALCRSNKRVAVYFFGVCTCEKKYFSFQHTSLQKNECKRAKAFSVTVSE
jgi:hypothetical protein